MVAAMQPQGETVITMVQIPPAARQACLAPIWPEMARIVYLKPLVAKFWSRRARRAGHGARLMPGVDKGQAVRCQRARVGTGPMRM